MRAPGAWRIAAHPVGYMAVSQVKTATGRSVEVREQRTHPLVERLVVTSGEARQELWVWLAPPPHVPTEAVASYRPGAADSATNRFVAILMERLSRRLPAGPTLASGIANRAVEGPFTLFHGDGGTFQSGVAGAVTGLVVIDGPLAVTGARQVRGLMLVRGTIRCGGGTLKVRGTLLVERVDPELPPMPCVEAELDRDAVAVALAFVGEPRPSPFHLRHWQLRRPI